MYKVIEQYESLYLTDESTGEILSELETPAVIFMMSEGMSMVTVVKIGNKEKLQEIYEERTTKLRDAGLLDLLQEYYILDLPKDVDVLNNIYNNGSNLLPLMLKLTPNSYEVISIDQPP